MAVMDWVASLIILGLMVIGFVFLVRLTRPLSRRFQRWVAAHRSVTEIVGSLVMIVWGASIWYLLISRNNYSNTLAMVMATLLICAGTCFLIIGLLKNRRSRS